ncbi:DUF2982 domain-containing protein [Colwellia hornerae]|uniref:DUF2982 domain-containing protein n=1 Tax=Colwellia hornerae TaxID=89402 RepID=A0A5C6QPW8_9GAMM|nr:DUF2982 domain-containing protein [Colwellia hornerae]TWX55674.1 DUF2982 domain-containing protein [Colwellia hornerae]TWX61884.1 DUF2982 domain-containing protein [Colwellia hornerae]TWX71216.1 DUF2982 domain-containing protein [Colwellia hornerae]
MAEKLVQQPSITIKPIAKHNGIFLVILGALVLFTTLLFAQHYWQTYRFAYMFMTLLSLVIILMGVVKLFEPAISLFLTPDKIIFNHRYGHWQLAWQDIKSINIITEVVGLDRETLPYIGIRLVAIENIANNISVRLANRLIHQQQGLIIYGVLHQLMTMEQAQMNFNPFILSNGERVKGPVAAFLHQSERLSSAFGYHLFLPADSFDRGINEFCQLIKQCQRASSTYHQS